MSRPTIGLAIIARDEEQTLPRLLASIESAFDRVVLLDTGSTDRTVELFQDWARQQTGMTYSVGHFEWVHDFAAARNAADRLLLWGSPHVDLSGDGKTPMVDWACWADCDDEIINARALRELAATAPDEVSALVFNYDYCQHPDTGVCICMLRRERLIRVGRGRGWVNRVHEHQEWDGLAQQIPLEVCHWRHVKEAIDPASARRSNARNLEILRRWVDDEPENTRVIMYLGTEELIRGRPRLAAQWLRRYFELPDAWAQQRAQGCRKMAIAQLQLGRPEKAREWSLRGITEDPSWPDNYLTLGMLAMSDGEPAKALQFARQVQQLGEPETMLIITPTDYTFEPAKLAACALGDLGRYDEAVAEAERALKILPTDQDLQLLCMSWRFNARRERTASEYVRLAQQLVAHDEQLKALTLLEQCVPHFAIDHAQVVSMRSFVRERIGWALGGDEVFAAHYGDGGAKPEDFHDDERALEIAASLPRVGFLVEGLREQGARWQGELGSVAA